MRWGLPPPAHSPHRNEPPRHNIWFRQIWPDERELCDPEARCLIVLDSFALPDGPAGARTRTYFGYDDRPIFAWAGIWRDDGEESGFAGFNVEAGPPHTHRTMPAIVQPSDYATWLTIDIASAHQLARTICADPSLYSVASDQPWSTNRST
ncbi:hypothetical protein ATM17_18215 [Sphingopyxis macrogoltabida]|uniref:DUF159 family protein n=2 Tax=Sphingopyxis macrogoltabida TaxID=33050 RepID=A0AAC9AWH4_SPHMC|nr:hypothetical protein ATM17_18215 [Sphingopyxis macrogoltabida]